MQTWLRNTACGLTAGSIALFSCLALVRPAPASDSAPSAASRGAPQESASDADSAAAAPGQTDDAQIDDAAVNELIGQLGSEKFSVRQEATRRLLELGIATQDALKAATTDADAEIRTRARAILNTVSAADFNHRLAAFAADYEGSQKQQLPGWEEFSARLGSSRQSRQLFVEMQKAEPELLEALARGMQPASEALAHRSQQILESQRETVMSQGTQAALLFVGSIEGVKVDEPVSTQLFPWVIQATFQRNAAAVSWTPIMKKLVGNWVLKDVSPGTTNQNMMFAAQLELKPETLAIATRILANSNSHINSRQMAILMLGRFGGPAQYPVLEKLLEDTTNCGVVPVTDPPGQMELQIRDISLAILVHLTGQSMRDYGYVRAQSYGPTVFQVGTLGFADIVVRETAFKRWAKWRSEHPNS